MMHISDRLCYKKTNKFILEDCSMNTEKSMKKWERIKRKGKTKYVLTVGIQSGGGFSLTYIIGILIKNANLYDPFNLKVQVSYDIYTLLAYFITGFISGVIGASISWAINEGKI